MNKHIAIDSTLPLQTPTPAQINAGQIWHDNHGIRRSRYIQVLVSDDETVACRNLKTGKNTYVRSSQFNRGKTGFTYVADLSDLSGGHLMTQLFVLKECRGSITRNSTN